MKLKINIHFRTQNLLPQPYNVVFFFLSKVQQEEKFTLKEKHFGHKKNGLIIKYEKTFLFEGEHIRLLPDEVNFNDRNT